MSQPRRDPLDLFENLLEQINALPAALRQATVDERWATIPLRIWESGYSPQAGAGVPVAANARSNIAELIQTVVVSVPPGGGTLQLDSLILPVPAGVTALGGLSLVLGPQDTRTLTPAQAGPAALWLFGEQLPTFGVVG